MLAYVGVATSWRVGRQIASGQDFAEGVVGESVGWAVACGGVGARCVGGQEGVAVGEATILLNHSYHRTSSFIEVTLVSLIIPFSKDSGPRKSLSMLI